MCTLPAELIIIVLSFAWYSPQIEWLVEAGRRRKYYSNTPVSIISAAKEFIDMFQNCKFTVDVQQHCKPHYMTTYPHSAILFRNESYHILINKNTRRPIFYRIYIVSNDISNYAKILEGDLYTYIQTPNVAKIGAISGPGYVIKFKHIPFDEIAQTCRLRSNVPCAMRKLDPYVMDIINSTDAEKYDYTYINKLNMSKILIVDYVTDPMNIQLWYEGAVDAYLANYYAIKVKRVEWSS